MSANTRPSVLLPLPAGLQVIHLTEDDTTSSSRIFIKILFQVGGRVGLLGWPDCRGLAVWQEPASALPFRRWVLHSG